MLLRRHHLVAMIAAGALGGGVAACGGAGDREDVNQSNEGRDVPEATPGTTESNPTQLTPTGEEQPEITQPPTDSPTVPGEASEPGAETTPETETTTTP
jgi:hypothetical protein